MKSKRWIPLACATALLTVVSLSSPTHANDYYTWLDERGKKVMSDRPPQDKSIKYEHVQGAFGARKDAPANRAFRPKDDPARPANGSPSSSASQQQPESLANESSAAKCEAAKERLFKLETFPQSRTYDENGEVRFMTDAERDQQKATNQQLIDEHCG
ncbi:hypothetical protein [Congregibacter sp.]|uniref:hypothetical protein n=1 Tax=Congregibacter sp. TaxID=2744308 RepID=UPI003F6CBC4E